MVPDGPVTGQASDGFTFRSDRLALDFAATLMFRGSRPRELLRTPEDLAGWAAAAGIVDELTPAPRPGWTLRTALALREAIYRGGLATLEARRPSPADVETLNRVAAAAPPLALRLTDDGGVRRAGTLAQALSTVARDAIELLGGADAGRLRQCGRDGCTRMFIDRSRGGSRVWCGMRECGNRVNAAAYRRRRSASR
jgi:predicted RNA-binding Zn ribbon-like protein